MTTSDRLIVVGCSVGGSCALQVAHDAPDRVAALVLVGTKARCRPDPMRHAAALETLHATGMDSAWTEQWAPLFSPATPAHVIEEARHMALGQPLPDIARGVSAFHTRTSRDDVLADFPGPVVVISGSDDRRHPGPVTSQSQADMARNGRFHLIPDCGHYVPMERPDALNAILLEVIAAQL
jgi:pimeloyl-ACP methyl ester carboxylesterase